MLYLYKRKDKIIVSSVILIGSKYKLIQSYPVSIQNQTVHFTKLNNHPINTNLFSSKLGYICIISKDYTLKLFDRFDILKDYPIESTDYVYEIYQINEVLKVHPYPFTFDNYYLICPICTNKVDKINGNISICTKCKNSMCNSCDLFNNQVCDHCNMNTIDL